MTRIDDLLEELCPDGVPVFRLGDIAQLLRGNGMPKSDLVAEGEGVGAIHYGQIYTRYGVWTADTFSFVSPETAVKLSKVNPGDIIITNTSENVDEVCKAVAWLGEKIIVTGGHATVIKHTQNPKYLSYWFQSESFFIQKRALSSGTKVIDVSAKQLMKVRIPVPPLEVQCEVVRILDQFAQLEAELEMELLSELKARLQQFEHYRDSLLTFPNGVRRIALGEIAELVRGNGMPKTDFVAEGVPAIHYGQIYTHYGTYAYETKSFVSHATAEKLTLVDTGDIVITNTSENIEDVGKAVAWLGAGQAVTGGHATVIKHNENPKFLAYYFQTSEFNRTKRKYVSGTKVIDLSAKNLAKINIPLPTRDHQDRIVEVLDKFDAILNDLSISLPAELAARRKQYEHYRNRLLTFEEFEAAA